MPSVRCMGCKRLVDKRLSRRGRCEACFASLKAERNRQHRNLGPCPQDVECAYCRGLHGPATPSNPMVWGHTVRFVDGGTEVAPTHKRCNESLQKRNRL